MQTGKLELRTLLISDTHFNHANIATYCDRPASFTETLIKRWRERVDVEDRVIHLGDVFMHKADGWDVIWPQLTGYKILVRGNHDRKRSCSWWMEHGFQFACDGLRFRGCWLTHEPDAKLPEGCTLNIHGHLHNIWHGFQPDARQETHLHHPFQRLFAVEYTNYCPIEFDEFVSHPRRYLATGLGDKS